MENNRPSIDIFKLFNSLTYQGVPFITFDAKVIQNIQPRQQRLGTAPAVFSCAETMTSILHNYQIVCSGKFRLDSAKNNFRLSGFC